MAQIKHTHKSHRFQGMQKSECVVPVRSTESPGQTRGRPGRRAGRGRSRCPCRGSGARCQSRRCPARGHEAGSRPLAPRRVRSDSAGRIKRSERSASRPRPPGNSSNPSPGVLPASCLGPREPVRPGRVPPV